MIPPPAVALEDKLQELIDQAIADGLELTEAIITVGSITMNLVIADLWNTHMALYIATAETKFPARADPQNTGH